MEQTTLATALPGEDANHKMANLERNYDELQVPPDVDVFWLVDMVNLVPPPRGEGCFKHPSITLASFMVSLRYRG